MSIVNTLSLESNREIKLNFDGGDLSSDSGLLLIKEFAAKKSLVHPSQQFQDSSTAWIKTRSYSLMTLIKVSGTLSMLSSVQSISFWIWIVLCFALTVIRKVKVSGRFMGLSKTCGFQN